MTRVYVGGPSGSGKTAAYKAAAQNLGISFLTSSERRDYEYLVRHSS